MSTKKKKISIALPLPEEIQDMQTYKTRHSAVSLYPLFATPCPTSPLFSIYRSYIENFSLLLDQSNK